MTTYESEEIPYYSYQQSCQNYIGHRLPGSTLVTQTRTEENK